MDYETAKKELDRITKEQQHAEYMRSKLYTAIDCINTVMCEEIAHGGYLSPFYEASMHLLKDDYNRYESMVIDLETHRIQQKMIVDAYFGGATI